MKEVAGELKGLPDVRPTVLGVKLDVQGVE